MYVVSYLHVYLHVYCVCRGQKRSLDSPDLKLGMGISLGTRTAAALNS